MSLNRDRLFGSLHTVVTCGALVMFAWLTIRQVGESAFLEDQVDQLQNFESLLRLRPEGLWGAVMSGTAPPARTLGPLGAVVFGLPVALGFGIDSIHVTTSLLLALAASCLRRPDRAMLVWLLVTGIFALQLHLVAAVAATLIVIVAAVTFREARRIGGAPRRRRWPWPR